MFKCKCKPPNQQIIVYVFLGPVKDKPKNRGISCSISKEFMLCFYNLYIDY